MGSSNLHSYLRNCHNFHREATRIRPIRPIRNRADRTQPHRSIPRLGHKLSNGAMHSPIPIRRQGIRGQEHNRLRNNLRNSPRNGVIRSIFCALRLSRGKRVPPPRNNILNPNSLNHNLQPADSSMQPQPHSQASKKCTSTASCSSANPQ